MATTSASDERACAPGMVSAGYAASYFGAPVAVELAREADLLLSGELPHEISHLDFWTLIYLHVAHTNDEAHGYAARRVPARSWSAVFAAVNQMRTLGDGLSKLVQISPIIRSNTRIRMAADLDTVRIDIFACEEIGDPQGRERYVESIALIVHCALLWMAKKPFQPAFVRVSQALAAIDGSVLSGLADQFERSGCGVTLAYPRKCLATPLGARRFTAISAHVADSLAMIRAHQPYRTRGKRNVVDDLRALLAEHPLQQSAAARRLGMSTATMKRRLGELDTSFRHIQRDVRRGQLTTLLARGDSLDEIAAELGFSDRRSVWRASCEWLGQGPSAYRAQQLQTSGPGGRDTITEG